MADCPNPEEPQGLKGRAMSKNNKGRNGGDRPTPKTTDSRNHTGTYPLIGWFNLAKPSRSRQQKRSWQRGGRR